MLAKATSCAVVGLDGALIQVEVEYRAGNSFSSERTGQADANRR